MLLTLNKRQVRNRRVASYSYPCIVLKVDNYGCQAEIEMRTRPVVVRGERLLPNNK